MSSGIYFPAFLVSLYIILVYVALYKLRKPRFMAAIFFAR